MTLVDPESLQQNELLMQVWRGLGQPTCYLTGGFLRDYLLGKESTDIDLSVVGDADRVAGPTRRLADSLGTRAHMLGEPPRCVWRVDTQEFTVELWPMGELTLNRDIQRRDFSCNAMMWDMRRNQLIDRVGGIADMERRQLRALSRENLRRDPIRLLRGARFLSTLEGFELEEETESWIRELAPQLGRAPRERIGHEFQRLLAGPIPSRGLRATIALDLVRWSAPNETDVDLDWLDLHANVADRLVDPEKHPISAALLEGDRVARLAFLLRAWGSPPQASVSEYAWNRQDRRLATLVAEHLDRSFEVSTGETIDRRELIYLLGPSFPALLALGSAMTDQSRLALEPWRRWWRQWSRSGAQLVDPPPLLGAEDVIEILGSDSGPELGIALRGLERAQARGEVRSATGAKKWLAQLAQDAAS
jgi:tRNA nucleotidyltransferase/poly(A) polymerase